MTEINYQILPNKFKEFKSFIKKNDGQPFSTFDNCLFISNKEDYKDSIYEEANRLLDFKHWTTEDIGTGKIMNSISSVIKLILNQENEESIEYLINRIEKTVYIDKMIQEKLFFDWLKEKISHEEAFTKMMELGFSISLIAFFFFLIDKDRYIPFSKSYINIAFEKIGMSHFKSNHITTWKNYESYCNIIHKVHNFLIRMDKNATLFNAYSFLWTLGLSADRKQKEEATKKPLDWLAILQDSKITKEADLKILQTIYSCDNHQAYGKDVGLLLNKSTNSPQSPINIAVGRYARRINKTYQTNFTVRDNGRPRLWNLFFHGWDEGGLFVWLLKEEIIDALEQLDLTGEKVYPDQIYPDQIKDLKEGSKKMITVNAYERNPKARKACIEYYGPTCKICDFNFEKVYGEIGKKYIHVHHVKPLWEIENEYIVDPINDLIPVCPNCHAMLHKGKNPLSIEELKEIIKKTKTTK